VRAMPVLIHHYVKIDNSSPENSLADSITAATEVVFTLSDKEKTLCTLEHLRDLRKGELVFRCHIAPKAFYKKYENDSANIIYGSGLFHTYFDGDGKRRPRDANLSWGVPPQFVMTYVSTDESNFSYVGDIKYTCINVEIFFFDPDCMNGMRGLWRDGTEYKSEICVASHFYSSNVEKTIKYIAIKEIETLKRRGFKSNPFLADYEYMKEDNLAEYEDENSDDQGDAEDENNFENEYNAQSIDYSVSKR